MTNVEKMMELIQTKKEKVTNPEDIRKVEYLEGALEDPELYFRIPPNVFMGILQFLDVPEEKLEEVYFDMISPKDFKDLKNKKPEVRRIIGE